MITTPDVLYSQTIKVSVKEFVMRFIEIHSLPQNPLVIKN